VSVDALEPDRIRGDCCIERRRGRKLFHRPLRLIPAAAEDPLAGARARGALANAFDDRLVGVCVGEIDDVEREAEAVQVRVRVRQAGKNRGVEHRPHVHERMRPLQLGGRTDFADHAVDDVDRVILARRLIGAGDDRAADEQSAGFRHWRGH
jgi:hypothetical protein